MFSSVAKIHYMNLGCRKVCRLIFCLLPFASATWIRTEIFPFFNTHPGIKGVLSIDKLSYDGLGYEEHLIFTVLTEDGTVLDEDIINSMLELPAEIIGECPAESVELIQQRKHRIGVQREQIEEANKQFYLDELR